MQHTHAQHAHAPFCKRALPSNAHTHTRTHTHTQGVRSPNGVLAHAAMAGLCFHLYQQVRGKGGGG